MARYGFRTRAKFEEAEDIENRYERDVIRGCTSIYESG